MKDSNVLEKGFLMEKQCNLKYSERVIYNNVQSFKLGATMGTTGNKKADLHGQRIPFQLLSYGHHCPFEELGSLAVPCKLQESVTIADWSEQKFLPTYIQRFFP